MVLCHNQLQSYADVQSTIAHELVHAYDNCRLPGMDWSDCAQHACSEVSQRATRMLRGKSESTVLHVVDKTSVTG